MDIAEKPLYIGGVYRHFKGTHYEVLGVARHTETQEELVVYRALFDPNELWVRPMTMFTETVLVNGEPQARFSWLAGVTRADLPSPDVLSVQPVA